VPIFFLLGRYDWQVPSILAKSYFDGIQAPYKKLIWFEQSGHNPSFEEPGKFDQVLIKEVLPVTSAR